MPEKKIYILLGHPDREGMCRSIADTYEKAAQKAGPGMMMSFVVAGIVCALAALCYSELSSMVPVAAIDWLPEIDWRLSLSISVSVIASPADGPPMLAVSMLTVAGSR